MSDIFGGIIKDLEREVRRGVRRETRDLMEGIFGGDHRHDNRRYSHPPRGHWNGRDEPRPLYRIEPPDSRGNGWGDYRDNDRGWGNHHNNNNRNYNWNDRKGEWWNASRDTRDDRMALEGNLRLNIAEGIKNGRYNNYSEIAQAFDDFALGRKQPGKYPALHPNEAASVYREVLRDVHDMRNDHPGRVINRLQSEGNQLIDNARQMASRNRFGALGDQIGNDMPQLAWSDPSHDNSGIRSGIENVVNDIGKTLRGIFS
ncbi:MAG: hypothetical protein CMM93_08505 [Rickettsiales bacterium]|mgnify:CR=1 FL=1|nr:hypothetical protein [Rickettsiales bacterium]|tara:strand:+ start:869 stop:1642 length:774 start_codon:yes stop_codon:yes gene_type:complete